MQRRLHLRLYRVLVVVLALAATSARAQFGVPPIVSGGAAPNVVTQVGDQPGPQVWTNESPNKCVCSPAGSTGAGSMRPIAETDLPFVAARFQGNSCAANRIVVTPDIGPEMACSACTLNLLTNEYSCPQSTTLPGRIRLWEVTGGADFVALTVPSTLAATRTITFNTDGRLKASDVIVTPNAGADRVLCVDANGLVYVGANNGGASACTGPTTSTSTTSTSTSTSTSTTTAGCSDSSTLKQNGNLGDFWSTDTADTAATLNVTTGDPGGPWHADGNAGVSCQFVKNAATLDVCGIKMCVGNNGAAVSGNYHTELRADATADCGYTPSAHCPSHTGPLGSASDTLDASALTESINPGSGACGTSTNGQVVTFTFSGTHPAPTGDFWVCLVSDTLTSSIRWGSNTSPTSYEDTTYDAFDGKGDKNQDFYFVVRTQ